MSKPQNERKQLLMEKYYSKPVPIKQNWSRDGRGEDEKKGRGE